MHTIRLFAFAALFSAGSSFAQNVGIAALTPGVITQFAGYTTGGCASIVSPAPASPYDGCPPAYMAVSNMHASTFDSAGNLYIADGGNHRIRKITPAGAVSTVAGSSVYAAAVAGATGAAIGDNGPATSAQIGQASGLAVDANFNIYFTDYLTNRVRVVYVGGSTAAALIALENPGITAQVGYIYTVAGNATYAYAGDGGLATSASFGNSSNVSSSNGMNGLAVDGAGNLYVADGTNDLVRKVTASTGIISTYAGELLVGGTPTNGAVATAAPIGVQRGLAANAAGDLFLIGGDLLMINGPNTLATTPGLGFGYAPGTFHILGGGGGYSGSAGPYNTLGPLSRFSSARQINLDAAGDVYISDQGYVRAYKIDVNDIITLIAGNSAQVSGTFAGTKPITGLNGPATSSAFGTDVSVASNPLTGDVYIQDTTNNVVLEVSASSSILNFGNQSVYLTSPTQTALVSNVSSGTLHLSGISFSTTAAFTQVYSGKTDCTASTVLAPGQSCQIAVAFTPVALGATTATITVTDDSTGVPGSIQTITLNGTGTAPASLTTLTATPSPASAGSTVVLKALVSSVSGTPTVFPTGTVTFYNGTNVLGTATINSSGVASFATSSLAAGTYTALTASYPGDSVYVSSTSAAASLSVVTTAGTSTALAATSQTIIPGTSVTFTATVNSPGGTPSGTATFYDGSTVLASAVALSSSGVATYTTTTLASGYHPISVIYAGNASFTASTSSPVNVLVAANATPVAQMIPGIISLLAGTSGSTGSTGDAGAAGSALLNGPTHLAMDAAGNLYIADSGNSTIRKVTASAGVLTSSSTISVIAGAEGVAGAAVGSAVSAARFQSPQGMAFDGAGNLYIADSLNHAIRKITASSGTISTTSTVSSVAGSQTQLGTGSYVGGAFTAGYTGDGGLATAATLNDPRDVAVDKAGNLYIADYGNNVIRMVNAATTTATTPGLGFGFGPNVIHTVAGSGRITSSSFPMGDGGLATSATFNQIGGVAVDLNGNLYISDAGNFVVRKVTASTGLISTYAGTAGAAGYTGDGAVATQAKLLTPAGLSLDVAGDLYVADAGNSVVREVTSAGTILTVAGTGTQGATGNGGPSTSAQFYTPAEAIPDGLGNLYVVDSAAATVRQINGQASALVFPAQAQNAISPNETVLLANPGGQPLTVSALAPPPSNFTQSTTVANSCSPTTVLASGATCAIAITASAPSAGVSTGSFTVTDNSVNKPASQQSISLSLTTDFVASQTINFPAIGPLTYGVSGVPLQATASSGLPVSYSVISGPGTVSGSTLTVLGAGSIVVQASQAGQSLVYFPAPSVMQTITVNKATLTVTATSFSQSTGIAIGALTYSISGFVNGESQSSATAGQPALSTTGTSLSPNGSYPITISQGTLTATNYSFSFVNGTLTLAGAAQFITFNALAPVTYSATPVVLAATSTSGLPITFTLVSGPGVVSGTSLTTTGKGTIVVQANQAGNYNQATNSGYGTAVPVQQSLVVSAAPLSVTVGNATRVYEAANPAFTSVVTGTVGSDVLTVTYSTIAVAGSVPGTYPIVATVAGANVASYSVQSTPGTLTITTATPTELLSTSSTSIIAGKSLALTATVSSQAGVTPTGTVSFYAGTTLLSAVALTNGTARLTTSSVPAGNQSITASYSGDSNYSPLVSSAVVVAVQSYTSVTIAASSSTANVGDPVTFTATITPTVTSNATPTGTVTFSLNGTTLATSTVSSAGTATFTTTSLPLTAPQSYPTVTSTANKAPIPLSISASYSGDVDFIASATAAPASETITPQFQINLTTASPTTGSVTATNEGTESISGTTTTFSGFGTVSITSGQVAQIQGTLIGNNDYSQSVALSCSGLPMYATCFFSSPVLAPTTVGAPFNIELSTAPVQARNDIFRMGPFGGIAVAAMLGFGLAVRRRRSLARLGLLCIALVGFVVTAGVSGCGTGSGGSAQNLVTASPGSYVITVIGTTSTSTFNSTFTLNLH